MALNTGDKGIRVNGYGGDILYKAIKPSAGDTAFLLDGKVIKAVKPSVGDKCLAYPDGKGGWIVFKSGGPNVFTMESAGMGMDIKVIKSTSDLEVLATYTTTDAYGPGADITNDDLYVFTTQNRVWTCGLNCHNWKGRIVKFTQYPLEPVAYSAAGDDINMINWAAIAVDSSYIYAASYNYPDHYSTSYNIYLEKINKNLAQVTYTTITWDTGIASITSDETYVWVTGSSSEIHQYACSDLSEIT